tara:strand:- start:16 stop:207 length:192 start_codon:yes stop_codon:yes gene_type:complete
MANQKLVARPETVAKAIEAIETKGPTVMEHKYNKNVSRENDQRCLKKLQQILSSLHDEPQRRY